MNQIDALLNMSALQVDQLVCGAISGAIVISAMIISPGLRRLAFVVAALGIVAVVLTRGLGGLTHIGDVVLTAAQKHEDIVKGLIAGKILAGLFWQSRTGAHS